MIQESILSSIEFQMSLLLFFSLGGYLLASRINQSAVVGEILVGILVGPSLIGLITYTGFVSSLASIGAVVLLFVVGLEFRLEEILNLKYGVIAFFGVIIPWISGYYLASLFGFGFGPAVFVGTALSATSIAITANVLKEMGKLQTGVAKTIIGAAVIDDILGLLALSMSNDIIFGSFSYSATFFIILKSLLFLFLGAFVGNRLICRAIMKIDNSKLAQKYPEFIFIFAIMVAFFYAVVAELIGLSAIVGSFIAGVSLTRVGLRHSKSFKDGAEYLYIIFASVFFVSLGILLDLKELTPAILLFSVVLTVVAILTKVIGCGVTAKLQGMTSKESMAVGFGMSPRGEVAMIVALIGLSESVIGQNIYIAIILMSLLTTIATPVILRNYLYKGEYEQKPDIFKKSLFKKGL